MWATGEEYVYSRDELKMNWSRIYGTSRGNIDKSKAVGQYVADDGRTLCNYVVINCGLEPFATDLIMALGSSKVYDAQATRLRATDTPIPVFLKNGLKYMYVGDCVVRDSFTAERPFAYVRGSKSRLRHHVFHFVVLRRDPRWA